MELDLQQAVDEITRLSPELLEGASADRSVLEDIARLASRHERLTELFRDLRERVGIEPPDPAED
jgi:hypothetical protein